MHIEKMGPTKKRKQIAQEEEQRKNRRSEKIGKKKAVIAQGGVWKLGQFILFFNKIGHTRFHYNKARSAGSPLFKSSHLEKARRV